MRRKTLMPWLLGLVLALPACDMVEDMTEMFERQGQAQDAIKEKYGWDTVVGFNIHNGTLTDVTVVFAAQDVKSEHVAKLREVARHGVSSAFAQSPRNLNVQISGGMNE